MGKMGKSSSGDKIPEGTEKDKSSPKKQTCSSKVQEIQAKFPYLTYEQCLDLISIIQPEEQNKEDTCGTLVHRSQPSTSSVTDKPKPKHLESSRKRTSSHSSSDKKSPDKSSARSSSGKRKPSLKVKIKTEPDPVTNSEAGSASIEETPVHCDLKNSDPVCDGQQPSTRFKAAKTNTHRRSTSSNRDEEEGDMPLAKRRSSSSRESPHKRSKFEVTDVSHVGGADPEASMAVDVPKSVLKPCGRNEKMEPHVVVERMSTEQLLKYSPVKKPSEDPVLKEVRDFVKPMPMSQKMKLQKKSSLSIGITKITSKLTDEKNVKQAKNPKLPPKPVKVLKSPGDQKQETSPMQLQPIQDTKVPEPIPAVETQVFAVPVAPKVKKMKTAPSSSKMTAEKAPPKFKSNKPLAPPKLKPRKQTALKDKMSIEKTVKGPLKGTKDQPSLSVSLTHAPKPPAKELKPGPLDMYNDFVNFHKPPPPVDPLVKMGQEDEILDYDSVMNDDDDSISLFAATDIFRKELLDDDDDDTSNASLESRRISDMEDNDEEERSLGGEDIPDTESACPSPTAGIVVENYGNNPIKPGTLVYGEVSCTADEGSCDMSLCASQSTSPQDEDYMDLGVTSSSPPQLDKSNQLPETKSKHETFDKVHDVAKFGQASAQSVACSSTALSSNAENEPLHATQKREVSRPLITNYVPVSDKQREAESRRQNTQSPDTLAHVFFDPPTKKLPETEKSGLLPTPPYPPRRIGLLQTPERGPCPAGSDNFVRPPSYDYEKTRNPMPLLPTPAAFSSSFYALTSTTPPVASSRLSDVELQERPTTSATSAPSVKSTRFPDETRHITPSASAPSVKSTRLSNAEAQNSYYEREFSHYSSIVEPPQALSGSNFSPYSSNSNQMMMPTPPVNLTPTPNQSSVAHSPQRSSLVVGGNLSEVNQPFQGAYPSQGSQASQGSNLAQVSQVFRGSNLPPGFQGGNLQSQNHLAEGRNQLLGKHQPPLLPSQTQLADYKKMSSRDVDWRQPNIEARKQMDTRRQSLNKVSHPKYLASVADLSFYCDTFLATGLCEKMLCQLEHRLPVLKCSDIRVKSAVVPILQCMISKFDYWTSQSFSEVIRSLGSLNDKYSIVCSYEFLWQRDCKKNNLRKDLKEYSGQWIAAAHAMIDAGLPPSETVEKIMNHVLKVEPLKFDVLDNLLDVLFPDFIQNQEMLWTGLGFACTVNPIYELPRNILMEILRNILSYKLSRDHLEFAQYLLSFSCLKEPEALGHVHELIHFLRTKYPEIAARLAQHYAMTINDDCCQYQVAAVKLNTITEKRRFSLHRNARFIPMSKRQTTIDVQPCPSSRGEQRRDSVHLHMSEQQASPKALSVGDTMTKAAPSVLELQEDKASQKAVSETQIKTNDTIKAATPVLPAKDNSVVSVSCGEVTSSSDESGTKVSLLEEVSMVAPAKGRTQPARVKKTESTSTQAKKFNSLQISSLKISLKGGSRAVKDPNPDGLKDQNIRPVTERELRAAKDPKPCLKSQDIKSVVANRKFGIAASIIVKWQTPEAVEDGTQKVLEAWKDSEYPDKVTNYCTLLNSVFGALNGASTDLTPKSAVVQIGVVLMHDLLIAKLFKEAEAIRKIIWSKVPDPTVLQLNSSPAAVLMIAATVFLVNKKFKEALDIVSENKFSSAPKDWLRHGTQDDAEFRDSTCLQLFNSCVEVEAFVQSAEKLFRSMLDARQTYSKDVGSLCFDKLVCSLCRSGLLKNAVELVVWAHNTHNLLPLKDTTHRLLVTQLTALPQEERLGWTPAILLFLQEGPYRSAIPASFEEAPLPPVEPGPEFPHGLRAIDPSVPAMQERVRNVLSSENLVLPGAQFHNNTMALNPTQVRERVDNRRDEVRRNDPNSAQQGSRPNREHQTRVFQSHSGGSQQDLPAFDNRLNLETQWYSPNLDRADRQLNFHPARQPGPMNHGPGGPVNHGPGGPMNYGPGGPMNHGPGGPMNHGPGGPMNHGPGGSMNHGPGGPMNHGPGGPGFNHGPQGPRFNNEPQGPRFNNEPPTHLFQPRSPGDWYPQQEPVSHHEPVLRHDTGFFSEPGSQRPHGYQGPPRGRGRGRPRRHRGSNRRNF